MRHLTRWFNMIIKKRRELRRWQRIVTVLAAIITFATTYALILPAITIEREHTDEVAGMYLEQSADADAMLEENAMEPTDVDMTDTQESEENAPTYSDTAADGEEITAAPKVKTLKSAGKDYTVILTYDEKSGIPDDAVLYVSEIAQDSDEYKTYLEEAKKAMGLTEEETLPRCAARFFDIKIMVGDQEFVPESGVSVEITYAEPMAENPETEVSAVHFADEAAEAEVIEASTTNVQDDGAATVEFTAESFSVYGVIYTVDFSWEVNGNVYECSIPGGGFASFTDLVEVLGIIGDTKSDEHGDENGPEIDENSDGYVSNEVVEENGGNSDTNMALTLGNVEISEITRKFVADVASVEFSSPELVDVSKVEAAITVGQIKENRELQCVYSVELTEEQIAKINAQTVDAGDWALISVQPFTSEETLTVTMRNGDCFTITVTDAQDAVMNPDGTTVQTISNPAGTTIDLFDYWVDTDLRNNDSRTAWPGYSDSWNPNAENLGGTGNEAGINAGHALKFSPAWEHTVINGTNGTHNTNGANGLNSYTGGINPFPGIVQSTLDNGYPKLTTNSTIGSDGESLAYLFDPNVSNNYRASYTGVSQLMYVDKDGYYTFDSQDYYARYNEGNKTFTVTEQTTNDSKLRGFWPFNDQSTATRNFWMGMHVKTQFSMPTGGQVLNPSGVLKPMQFEFSGDDDVWIYVDGILIGDAGGIHNRTEVDINFQTGKVSITGQQDKYLDDLFRTGLRDRGKTETEIEEYIADKFDGHTFKAGSYHTFDFFYLERGGEESNLYIHYNLVSTADFTAHKSYYGTDGTDILRRDQFQFELIGLEEDAIMPSGGSAEGMGTVVSPKLETDEYGHKIFTTGVTEDGNVNFGSAVISEEQKRDKPTYHYIVREVVPDEAVNANGTTWAEATDEEKNAGGFVLNQVEYDQTIYYMAATVTSWEETDTSGRPFIRYGLDKKYYTDDTYTTPKQDINFISFLNRYKPVYGNVDFTKVNGTGDPLQGAVFTLYKDEVCTIPATDLDTEGHPVWTARSDLNGKVSFENVRVGTYYMKETTAPENYALSEIIYKVVVEDEKDTSKTSRITILGDESGTIVDSIANAKSGEITVLKKWLNVAGTEVDGGSNTAKVKLKRYKQVVESSNVETHTVTINLAIRDYSGNSWTETAEKSFRGDHVTVEWTVVDGANDNVFTGQDSSYWDESSRITVFSKSFSDVSSDITLNVILNEYWPMQNGKFNIDSFSIAQEEPDEPIVNIVADDDFDPDSITLNSSSSWSQTWNIGGTESSHNGFDFPAMDDNGRNYLYYVVELDTQGNAIEVGGSPLEGYVLQGYSANNNTGVSNQGVITIYNRAEGSDAINVVIKKTDNVENSTNYLDGAVFKMMYRSDSSGTFTNVSNESVPELDSDSQFTVPTAGIILTGLVDGQYLLQEISPPSGYVITNSTPVTFTVSGGTITSTEGTITGVRYTAATETSNAEFIVPNPPGAALPNTGGPGTTLYTVLGSILILGAAFLLLRRKTI